MREEQKERSEIAEKVKVTKERQAQVHRALLDKLEKEQRAEEVEVVAEMWKQLEEEEKEEKEEKEEGEEKEEEEEQNEEKDKGFLGSCPLCQANIEDPDVHASTCNGPTRPTATRSAQTPSPPPPPPPPAPDCPICFEPMTPPTRIFLCGAGHLVCGACKSQLQVFHSSHYFGIKT